MHGNRHRFSMDCMHGKRRRLARAWARVGGFGVAPAIFLQHASVPRKHASASAASHVPILPLASAGYRCKVEGLTSDRNHGWDTDKIFGQLQNVGVNAHT